ncbi:MAG: radical SAM/SPASM domain-containing protein [Candidatus Latescibacterota bacterium]
MSIRFGRTISDGLSYAAALAGFVSRSGRALGGPQSCFIEPTNICNLRCPLCATGAGLLNRSSGHLDLSGFERIVKKLPASVTTLYLWGQGEPFLAPGFPDMVRFAADRGFRTITSTNGHFLENAGEIAASGLDMLIVSLDGADAETYAAYRIGGDFERVVHGVRKVVEAGKRSGRGPIVRLQCVVNRLNENSRGQFQKLAAETGVHQVVFKTLQAAFLEGGDTFVPRDSKLSRYRRGEHGKLEPDRREFFGNRCLRLYYSLQVDCRGDVVPCCFDKNSEYVMGNLLEDSFRNIWNGERFCSFRTTLNRQGRVLPMCRDCTEGLRRKHIHA